MQKKIAYKEREIKRQKKEVETTQQATIVANANIIRIQRHVERREITIFNSDWSLANVKEVIDRLHMQIVLMC
jgi:rRNA maturation endonuclease Nob1